MNRSQFLITTTTGDFGWLATVHRVGAEGKWTGRANDEPEAIRVAVSIACAAMDQEYHEALDRLPDDPGE